MIDPANVPPVARSESLARYVLTARHVRSSNGSIKQDAFIPSPHVELSVTRHFLASAEEIWAVGEDVAKSRDLPLVGRADIEVDACLNQNLTVAADPLPGNPNHALINEWPAEKAKQKLIAIEIAATARYLPAPK
jgi:hypothetical protein